MSQVKELVLQFLGGLGSRLADGRLHLQFPCSLSSEPHNEGRGELWLWAAGLHQDQTKLGAGHAIQVAPVGGRSLHTEVIITTCLSGPALERRWSWELSLSIPVWGAGTLTAGLTTHLECFFLILWDLSHTVWLYVILITSISIRPNEEMRF